MGPKRGQMGGGGMGGGGRSGRGRGGRGRGRGRGGGGAGDEESNNTGGIGMKWPPVVENVEVYGEVKDVNKRNLPRDQGRSIQLGEHRYYVFGDTFCHNDGRQFVGTTDNTVAYIPDITNPTKSQYLHDQPRVPQFIPYTDSERAYLEAPENKKVNSRIVLWAFGGVVEDSPGCGEGWVFFDKQITNGSTPGKIFGVGIARVSLHDGHRLRVTRPMEDRMLFGNKEPKFGGISVLSDDDGWVYLFGHKNGPGLKNHWARVRRGADFADRDNYEFLLNGGKWSKTYELDTLKTVMPLQAQGDILKLPGFAPPDKGPYMWFGVNKYMSNCLFVGASRSLAGPWDVQNVMQIPKFLGQKSKQRYCLYPHPWGADQSKGEMLITWSDNGDFGGRVAAAMFTFAMVGGAAKEGTREVEPETQAEEAAVDQDASKEDTPGESSNDGGMAGLKEKFSSLWKS